jgi:hypothetical protein
MEAFGFLTHGESESQTRGKFLLTKREEKGSAVIKKTASKEHPTTGFKITTKTRR